MRHLVLACLVLIACKIGDEQQMMVDAPPGTPMCTKAVYDPCTTADQCTSGDCHVFDMSNFTVCTQACSASNPCPNDSTGTPGMCNNRGICKPSTPNVCVP